MSLHVTQSCSSYITNVISTPDLPLLCSDSDGTSDSTPKSSRRRKQRSPQQIRNGENSCKLFPCVFCTETSFPSFSLLSQHFETYHRMSTLRISSNCPLCSASIRLLDLSSHLSSSHGLLPSSAVNSLLLLTLSSLSLPPTKSKFYENDERTENSIENLTENPIENLTENPIENGNENEREKDVYLSFLLSKLTRSHVGLFNKKSFQCLLCSKWFAVPPLKHLRSHLGKAKGSGETIGKLVTGIYFCFLCNSSFECENEAKKHEMTHSGVEFDNAGRVKSGKVRKQCELCGEWSNIKWFFKHMSEVHRALFCRCCREYLPIEEQEDHRRWHAEPPYMGQKIRIENGIPIIIDRKERASLTPIGSLAPWGGSSGGLVVKASPGKSRKINGVSLSRKRKSETDSLFGGTRGGEGEEASSISNSSSISKNSMTEKALKLSSSVFVKDTLMPKETCPVCGILITYKNLARHIKLRHKIKYKFCHKCRKLVPNVTYEAHKASHSSERSSYKDPSFFSDNLSESIDGILNDVSSSSKFKNESVHQTIETLREYENDENDENENLHSKLQIDWIDKERNEDDEDGLENDDENKRHQNTSHLSSSSSSSSFLDTRKTESFRANTSKTKLESLLGKEFKHPRRRCALCGYSVSYSNFKRHLRNAHPSEYQECENNPGAFKRALATLALSQDEQLETFNDYKTHPADETITDEDVNDEEDKNDHSEISFSTCSECGEQISKDFLDLHMTETHSPLVYVENGLQCPICSLEMKSRESILNHCVNKHKTPLSKCEICRKYIVKRVFSEHVKSHDVVVVVVEGSEGSISGSFEESIKSKALDDLSSSHLKRKSNENTKEDDDADDERDRKD